MYMYEVVIVHVGLRVLLECARACVGCREQAEHGAGTEAPCRQARKRCRMRKRRAHVQDRSRTPKQAIYTISSKAVADTITNKDRRCSLSSWSEGKRGRRHFFLRTGIIKMVKDDGSKLFY